MEIRYELNVFGNSEIPIQTEALRHVSNARIQRRTCTPYVSAEHRRTPSGRFKDSGQHPKNGRLAGTVRPDKPKHLASGHLERDKIYGYLVPEALCQILTFDDPFHSKLQRPLR